MGFGNFLKGVGAAIIPGGKSYGDYNPPKKKKEEEDNSSFLPASSAPKPPRVQQPQNRFDTGLAAPTLPGAPKTAVSPFGAPVDLTPLAKPQPGQVIMPSTAPKSGYQQAPGLNGTRATKNGDNGIYVANKKNGKQTFVPDAPKPQDNSAWGKFKRGVSTVRDTAVGTVANVPEVGLAVGRTATGLVQGVTQIPHIATAGVATGTEKLNKVAPNRFTSAINTGAQAANTGTKKVTEVVNKPIDAVNRTIDRAAQGYEDHVPMAAGGAEAYRATQVPLNALAALLTVGGSTAATTAGQGGKVAQVSRFLNAPRVANTENVISKTAQTISNRSTPVVQALNTPFRSTTNGITRFIGRNRNLNTAEREIVDAGETGNVLSHAQLDELTAPPTQIEVQQPTQIDVNAPATEPVNIPVRNTTPVGTPIRELAGDTPGAVRMPTPEEVAAQRAVTNFERQVPGRPDRAIEGVTPRTASAPYSLPESVAKGGQDEIVDAYAAMLKNTGEGNGTQLVPDGEGGYFRTSNNYRTAENKGKRMTKEDWRARAEAELKAGRGETGHQQAFNDAADPEVQSLLANGDTSPVPEGRPITVKEVKGIPVRDESIVPEGLPETPGQVRTTTQKSPMATKTEAAASDAPIPSSPAQLPSEVQAVLDNPKQFNKRQVAAARNQRKLARQMAKTQEQTAEALDRIKTVSPAHASDEGFVPTGEFGRSVNGGGYQKVHRATEMQQAVEETANLSPADVIKTARENQAGTGGFNRRDIRNLAALFEQKRIPRGTPEWEQARQILKEDGTIWGQTGALRNYTMRRTASADELMSRYESKIYRLADDPSKIDSASLDAVEVAENKYTDARDAALEAYNRFTEAPTNSNAKVYHAAQDAADAADKEAKMVEFKVANKVLKGNKDTKQARELEKMAQNADMYQMDSVDASMLSGTGTFVRNFVNAAVGGAEEGLFGKIAAKISGKLTGEAVGGGAGRGTIRGFKQGAVNVVDASKARAGEAGWNPLEHVKNWATTGNQLGDTVIDSQTTHNVLDHYTQMLKAEGYTGRELTDRASVMARQDPNNMERVYAQSARVAAGLGAGITRNNKIETIVKDMISDAISGGKPNRFTENTAKLITRMTLGFPTAIGRSVVEGTKRFTLGAPTFIKAGLTKDPQARALLIKEGIKQAGTGAAVIPPLFYALGQSGAITGAYPEDQAERDRWKREGITENSIRIGDNYYQLPAYLGSWAVPGLFYANLGANDGDWGKAAAATAKVVPSILPTDQMTNITDVINGRSDLGKFMAQTGASAIRAMEPGGALLNQLAKSFDPTQNDTNSGSVMENLVDKVLSGIPGVNNAAGIPDKLDDAGNALQNPGALPLALGAASTTQNKGVERSGEINDQTNTAVKEMDGVGAFKDPNLKAILTDDKIKKIYADIQAGKQVKPDDVKKLQSALVKGVSESGDDTAYLEKEQYDTNLTALNLKRSMMASDPTTKPSDLKKMDDSIKRGQVYKDTSIPYEMIDAYKGTSLSDWRSMGDPESDSYDPDMYQKLFDVDEALTKAGVSYNKTSGAKNKFTAKEGKAGGSGSRGGYSSDFGTLKAGVGAPTVQQYESIDQASGSVPVIRVQRPNIVHKIGSS